MNLRGRVTVKYRDLNYDWVDVTNGILQADITRGIPQYFGMWSQCQPGQLTLRSRNINLDPSRNNQIDLFSVIRIEVDGTPLFTGKIFDTSIEYFPKDDTVVTLVAFDELGVLSQTKWGNAQQIGHDYSGPTNISPITFGNFLQYGNFYPNYGGNGTQRQTGYLNGNGLKPNYSAGIFDSSYNISGGVKKHSWQSSDQNKYPTPNGASTYLVNAPTPAAGYSTDSTWTLPDWDGVVVTNPRASGNNSNPTTGFGVVSQDGTTSSTSVGLTYLNKDGIYQTSYGQGSLPYITDANHPLYNSQGFNTIRYGSVGQYAKNDWAALYSTNDSNALTLWQKCEQSEAGFGFVDAYNRFRHYGRTIIGNDSWHPKAVFSSSGGDISYNSIKITNGWESVVRGVTINNIWSNATKSIHNMSAYYNAEPATPYYTKNASSNRDGTTTNKILNPASGIKTYEWLPYAAVEERVSWEKLARTVTGSYSPIYDSICRDWDINNLSTISKFKGTTTVTGNNQLSIDTNYAWELNTEPGGFMRKRDGSLINYSTGHISYNIDTRTEELADIILNNYSNPVTDIRSINFNVHAQDISQIKSLDIFDRITINHNEAGLVVNKDYAIMGITHSITPDNWDISYQLWNQQGRP